MSAGGPGTLHRGTFVPLFPATSSFALQHPLQEADSALHTQEEAVEPEVTLGGSKPIPGEET